ncbi:MAG: MoaD/ThiS family protein [Actinomycetes bacterium]
MAVTVRLFAAARAAAGVSQLEVAAGSVQGILDSLVKIHPALRQVLPQCSYLLDELALHDLGFQVNDGSTLDILPPFAGG